MFFGYVNQIYGVTRDPLTHEYAIVTRFQNGGNLRRVISEIHTRFIWEIIFARLRGISIALSIIHERGYHHKDFHSGNILNSLDIISDTWDESTISDFVLQIRSIRIHYTGSYHL